MEYESPYPYIEKKGLFYRCNLCASLLNSMAQVQSHISGSNHQSRLYAARLELSQAEANMHSTQQKLSAFNLTYDSNLPQYIEKQGVVYKCICCETGLNSKSQIVNHVAGAKHLKKASSFCVPNSSFEYGAKMEGENISQPLNDYTFPKISSTVCSPGVPNSFCSSNLPPYVELCGDQYRCGCCNIMLNSTLQLNSHVNGTKHIKMKLFYDKNPSLSIETSGGENIKQTKNMEESFSLCSALEEINPEELMKNVKIFKANEAVIF